MVLDLLMSEGGDLVPYRIFIAAKGYQMKRDLVLMDFMIGY